MHSEKMRGLYLLLPLFLASFSTIKEKIQEYERHGDQFALAKAYLEDQEIEKSFKAFLNSLESVQKLGCPKMSHEEKSLFEEGMELYLKEGINNPQILGKTLIEKFENVAKQHPQFHHLQLLMAVAYANVSEKSSQFNLF